jgi:hypothetical protein
VQEYFGKNKKIKPNFENVENERNSSLFVYRFLILQILRGKVNFPTTFQEQLWVPFNGHKLEL